METLDLHAAIDQLPPALQLKVADYVAYLQYQQTNSPSTPTTQEDIRAAREAAFGALKGKIWMADDFDAPLDDFKEYM
jgi:hypothetical protein